MKSLFSKALTLTLVFAATLCGCSESPETYSFDSSDESRFSVSSVSSEPEIVSEEDSSEESVEHVCDFGPWVILYEPTCVESGRRERACPCGSSETEEIEALGHQVSSRGGRLPTCEEDGETPSLVCDVCHVELEESTVIPKTGHSYQKNRCKNCGNEITDLSELPQNMRDDFAYALIEKYGKLFGSEEEEQLQEILDLQIYLVELYEDEVERIETKIKRIKSKEIIIITESGRIKTYDKEAVALAERELEVAKAEYETGIADGETYLMYYLVVNEDILKKIAVSVFSEKNADETNKDILETITLYTEVAHEMVKSKYSLFYNDEMKEYVIGWARDIVADIREVTGIDISK